MQDLSLLFSSVAVMAEFHPRARALKFWRESGSRQLRSDIIFYERTLTIKEELEADIACIATRLSQAALPDYHAFCMDVKTVFMGGKPYGPIAQLQDLDWTTFHKIASYAHYWKERNPVEVSKLITFVMAIPLFSRLAGQLIIEHQGQTENQIYRQLVDTNGVFLLGVNRFCELFDEELAFALTESKRLVSVFYDTRSEEAATIINGMVAGMVGQKEA